MTMFLYDEDVFELLNLQHVDSSPKLGCAAL